jgi:hypothetical protein
VETFGTSFHTFKTLGLLILKASGFSCEAAAVFGRESERTLFSVKKGSLGER